MITAILFSTGGAAIKGNELSAWQVASFRCAIAAITLLILIPDARRNWSWRIVPPSLAYGAMLVVFVLASKLTTSANAIFLQSTAPAYLVILSPLLLRERLKRSDILLLGGVAAGMLMLFLGPQRAQATATSPATGNVLAAMSGVLWAFTVTGLRWLGRSDAEGSSATAAVVMGNVVGFLMALPMAVPVGDVRMRDIAVLVYLGVFQIGVAYLLLSRAIRHVPAFEATTLLLVEPALNPIWTWIILRENPGEWAIAGGAVILTVTLIKTWWEQRETKLT